MTPGKTLGKWSHNSRVGKGSSKHWGICMENLQCVVADDDRITGQSLKCFG